jgi:hypothetical protein
MLKSVHCMLWKKQADNKIKPKPFIRNEWFILRIDEVIVKQLLVRVNPDIEKNELLPVPFFVIHSFSIIR